jgi:hypothetical protein
MAESEHNTLAAFLRVQPEAEAAAEMAIARWVREEAAAEVAIKNRVRLEETWMVAEMELILKKTSLDIAVADAERKRVREEAATEVAIARRVKEEAAAELAIARRIKWEVEAAGPGPTPMREAAGFQGAGKAFIATLTRDYNAAECEAAASAIVGVERAITNSGTQPDPDPTTIDPEEMREFNVRIAKLKARYGFE